MTSNKEYRIAIAASKWACVIMDLEAKEVSMENTKYEHYAFPAPLHNRAAYTAITAIGHVAARMINSGTPHFIHAAYGEQPAPRR